MATDRETQLLLDATKAGITSPKELANFMAQVSAESGGLTRLNESFRYTRDNSQIPVKYAHRQGEEVLTAARLEALNGKPEKLAELMYGGRMGNDQPGDGYTYRGRGYMQLTGKDNYAAAGKALGLDLVKHPELAAEPQNASKIATWYWENRVPEAAHGDVKKATYAINGGYNGLDTREAQFKKWEKTLTPEVMGHLSKGEPVLSIEPARAPQHATAAHHRHTTEGNGSDIDIPAVISLERPENRHHRMYLQAREAVHKLDANLGRTSDVHSDQLAAASVVEALRNGLTKIDAVRLSSDGSQVMIVQGNPDSPGKQAAYVQTAQAVNTPIEQSSAAAQAIPHKPADPTQAAPAPQHNQVAAQ